MRDKRFHITHFIALWPSTSFAIAFSKYFSVRFNPSLLCTFGSHPKSDCASVMERRYEQERIDHSRSHSSGSISGTASSTLRKCSLEPFFARSSKYLTVRNADIFSAMAELTN